MPPKGQVGKECPLFVYLPRELADKIELHRTRLMSSKSTIVRLALVHFFESEESKLRKGA